MHVSIGFRVPILYLTNYMLANKWDFFPGIIANQRVGKNYPLSHRGYVPLALTRSCIAEPPIPPTKAGVGSCASIALALDVC